MIGGECMSSFDLVNENIDDWETAEFWVSDPMQQNQSLCSIILYVRWKSQEVYVDIRMQTNSTSMEVWNGLSYEYRLPVDTNFKEFSKYYKENIKPVLQEMGKHFESYWNGSNWKGKFKFVEFKDEEDEYFNSHLEVEAEYEYNQKMEDILFNVPTHDMVYYFSLRDSYEYGGIGQIIDDLKSEKIDIYTADLNNEEIMKRAVYAVTWNDGSDYKLINVDVENELKEIQEELKEEIE